MAYCDSLLLMKLWRWVTRAFAYGTALGAVLKLNFFTVHDRWDESAQSHVLYGRYPAWMGPAFGGWMSSALDCVVLVGLICALLFVVDLALAFSGRESWGAFLF